MKMLVVKLELDCKSPHVKRDHADYICLYRVPLIQRIFLLISGSIFIRVKNTYALRKK